MYAITIYLKNRDEINFYDVINYACIDNNTILRMVGEDSRVIEFVIHNIAGYEVIPRGEIK